MCLWYWDTGNKKRYIMVNVNSDSTLLAGNLLQHWQQIIPGFFFLLLLFFCFGYLHPFLESFQWCRLIFSCNHLLVINYKSLTTPLTSHTRKHSLLPFCFAQPNATLVTMQEGETLDVEANPKGGIYVIISGLVKVITWYLCLSPFFFHFILFIQNKQVLNIFYTCVISINVTWFKCAFFWPFIHEISFLTFQLI